MITKKWPILAMAMTMLLTSGAAHARRHHRRGGGGTRSALRGGLSSIKPTTQVTSNKCDIRIDCPHYKVTVNGRDVGQIICGSQTGTGFSKKKVTLDRSVTPASGRILPYGFPMLATNPPLCNNCFIHVYPHVGPSASSLGCVGIEERAWNEITKCGGSDIAFVAMNGTKSLDPEQMVVAVNETGHAQASAKYTGTGSTSAAPVTALLDEDEDAAR